MLCLVAAVCLALCGPLAAHDEPHKEIERLSRAIEWHTTDANLFLARAGLHRMEGHWQAALADLDRAAELDPLNPTIDFHRGRLCFEAGEPQAAREDLDRFLAKHPNHVQGLMTRARTLRQLDEPLLAARDYSNALAEISDPRPVLFLERADALAAAGDEYLASAIAGLDEGIEQLGSVVPLQAKAIDLELRAQRYDSALDRIDHILSTMPRKERWLARRGEVLERAGQIEEARESYSEALAAIERLPWRRREAPAIQELATGLVSRLTADDGKFSDWDELTVTVDSNGTVLNVPGDFSSIQAAHDAANSGDTILVAPGTYVGQITLTKAITLASHYLTTGDESYVGVTILDGGNASYTLEIPASAEDRPTIQGFTIQNSDDGISPHARFNILNCVVWDTSDGIDYESGSGGLVRFCIFEQNSDDGIDLDNEVDIVIEDNIIRNNNDDGIEIRMQGYTGPALDIIIRRNQIHGNGEDGIQLIHYDVLTDRFFEITENFIYDNVDVGIGMMDGSTTNEDFRAASIPETIYVFNNTFANNSHGITGGDNTVVLNNIFVDHSVIAVKNVDANSELAFNLFFNNGTDNSGSNVDTGSSVFDDPFLAANLELQAGSPAIDAGTAFYSWQGTTVLNLPPTAYAGAAPDLGAYEFDSGGGPPPDPPNLVTPPDGAVDVSLTPILVWSGDGDTFRVQIASDSAFGSLVDTGLVSTTEYVVGTGTLDYSTTYFWRVNASNQGGTSDFSAAWSFTTEAASAPPDPPVLQSPANGAMDVPLEATLQWAGTADDFDVDVASDPSFTNIVFAGDNVVSTAITLSPSPLDYETVYYWRVLGNNNFGAGNFSDPFTFTTVAAPDTEPPLPPQNLSSPAQTGTTIDLLWDASTDNVGVSFYNIYRDDVQIASESSTNHTAVGLSPATSYNFQVSAVDEALNESPLSGVLTVATQSVSEPTTIDVRVSASSDDAEEDTSGGMDLTSSDLELIQESTAQTVGMRFNGVAIPANATIVDASIQFQVDETTSPPDTSLTIEGQAIGNAPTFTSSKGDISSRTRTTAAVPWSPPPWPTTGAAGPDQRTPNIASVIQEIVNLPGWSSGNSLVIIITGTGERVAESYNGDSSGAPLLHVEFSTGPPANQAPTANAGGDQTITLPNDATLAGSVTDDGVPDPALLTA
jgi:parallel beta-helix repeat protein